MSRIVMPAIVLLAVCLRLFGISWDDGYYLHPDERFLTMVTAETRIPNSLGAYLDPNRSTMNPYQINREFFVYGTLPMTITKLLAVPLGMDSYGYVGVLGRLLSATADMGILLYTYAIARLWQRRYKLRDRCVYLSVLFYAVAVLPIQHAHFYTVDSFATFFMTAALYYAMSGSSRRRLLIFTGVSAALLACAVASKVSSILVAPLIVFYIVRSAYEHADKSVLRAGLYSFGLGCLSAVAGYVTLRFADPHLFASAALWDMRPNPQFIANLQELTSYSNPQGWFPPAMQWMSKTPLIFPLRNLVVFGLGIPYAISALFGFVLAMRARHGEWLVVSIWAVLFFIYQGAQFAASMRYFYILYPFAAIAAAYGVDVCVQRCLKPLRPYVLVIALVVIFLWPVSFMSIYTRPHSRITASEWIYTRVPSGAVIAVEYWDDSLPLQREGYMQQYRHVELPVFAPDTSEKWQIMNEKLQEADYYVLSSNRGYGSIMPLPERYPLMSTFYEDLFAERLPFTMVADFTSFPTLPLLFTSLPLNDQWAEEAFSVYDHPRVTIFKKTEETKR